MGLKMPNKKGNKIMGLHLNISHNNNNKVGGIIFDGRKELSGKYVDADILFDKIRDIAEKYDLPKSNIDNDMGYEDYLFTRGLIEKYKNELLFSWENKNDNDLWVDSLLEYMKDNNLKDIWIGIDY